MLIELDCNQFKETAPHPIQFAPGLNIILGTDDATNSIGKSTSLMILDFVFGGDDYLGLSKDVRHHIGEHSFRFAFSFNGEIYRYMRGTAKPNEVSVCDEYYHVEKTMPLKDYRNMLSCAYGLSEIGISWREAVSGTFRIWQRDNDKPTLPLSTHRTDTHLSGIKRLLALFGKLTIIQDALNREEEAKAAVDAAKVAHSLYNWNIASNKKEYDDNERRIQELEAQLEDIQHSFGMSKPSELSEQQIKLVAELKREQTPLYRKRTILMNQLSALKSNKEAGGRRRSTTDFEELKEFIPELDADYLEKIEHFHDKIKTLVIKQVKSEIDAATEKLAMVQKQLEHIDEQIMKITTAPNITIAGAETYANIKAELAKLCGSNLSYRTRENYKQVLKSAQESLEQNSKLLLAAIENEINAYLDEVDGGFTDNKRNPPKLMLKKIDSYAYAIADDTGTGSGFRSLLSFDLALLEHSRLPVIIEDSFLFKQIENAAVERIIAHYSTIEDKQIFIALDEIDKYKPEAQELIRSHTRLHLASGKEALFAEEWGKKKS